MYRLLHVFLASIRLKIDKSTSYNLLEILGESELVKSEYYSHFNVGKKFDIGIDYFSKPSKITPAYLISRIDNVKSTHNQHLVEYCFTEYGAGRPSNLFTLRGGCQRE